MSSYGQQIAMQAIDGMVSNAMANNIHVSKRMKNDGFGKIQFSKEWLIDHESPWIHINHLKENKCLLWRDIIYNGISRNLKKKQQFVHTGCQGCYKVVARPRTYKELIVMEAAMEEAAWPSKIGIEKRPFVKALYGAYFYNRGIRNGLKRLKDVKNMVDCLHIYSDDSEEPMEVYLKRGCTEMEMEQGRSDKWSTKIIQVDIEETVDELLYTPEQPDQTDEQKAKVLQSWKEWAWKHDSSYDGPPPSYYKDCVRY